MIVNNKVNKTLLLKDKRFKVLVDNIVVSLL